MIIIIPARLRSARFHGKPLIDINGYPLIVRVWLNAIKTGYRTVVATPDPEIASTIRNIGGEAILNESPAQCGSERVIETLDIMGIEDEDEVINLQGDTLVDSKYLKKMAATEFDPKNAVTLHKTMFNQVSNPNAVKVTFDRDNTILNFGRLIDSTQIHVGAYLYVVETMRKIYSCPPTQNEMEQGLEQLRATEKFNVKFTSIRVNSSTSVDTRDDLAAAREYCLS
jgi:3-deoxy-manno-octulosonate cytidylyltransferase (CMP-KDO synthetase)